MFYLTSADGEVLYMNDNDCPLLTGAVTDIRALLSKITELFRDRMVLLQDNIVLKTSDAMHWKGTLDVSFPKELKLHMVI